MYMLEAAYYNQQRYNNLIKLNGYTDVHFAPIDFALGKYPADQIATKWLCQIGADTFASRLNTGEPSIVCTGIGLSGAPHAGTLSQIMKAIALQNHSIPVQMVLGDVDAHLGKRRNKQIIPLSYVDDLAGRYSEFAEGLGFNNSAPSTLRTQIEHTDVMRTSILITPYVTDEMFVSAEEELHAEYVNLGKVDSTMTPSRKASLLLMTADFLHHPLAGRILNVCVTLGVDEHQYVRFGQQVLEHMRENGVAPFEASLAGIYTTMLRGFNGATKQSKSIPGSGVDATMSAVEIVKRITLEDTYTPDQPEDNPTLQMIEALENYSMQELLVIREQCNRRDQNWDNIKHRFADYVVELFSHWRNE